ncbi:hypothetical protein BCR33DRAFT_765724 [Rhizoclosmatium globosum]|uniref:CxC2-like cysteine cluster KDZ transposase-associated domain-containing protein n=1 Tax=Rhizoclosmatium globosum TaxID=329046 RepID=A0A1Y2CEI1_9FUNG|nr:hypothetical protein BCR33DRAFT_765724 [Rhizoclosmatium globosum]|eukprot:ORY45336.1 hypothetical protein BCR33DRAFT_765724 [Rhizoclosmatium globosum]
MNHGHPSQQNFYSSSSTINKRKHRDLSSDSSDLSDADSELQREAWAFVEQQQSASVLRAAANVSPTVTQTALSSPNPWENADNYVADSDDEAESVGSNNESESIDVEFPDMYGVWTEGHETDFTSFLRFPTSKQVSPKLWKKQREKWFADTEAVLPLLIIAVACLETVDIASSCCAAPNCSLVPSFKCYTCAVTVPSLSHFCSTHASGHWWDNHCHRVQDRLDRSPAPLTTPSGRTRSKKIRCCEAARGTGRRVLLHSLTGHEPAQLVTCPNHANGHEMCVVLLRDYGFFPSRVHNTDHAFSFQLVSLGLKLRSLGVAFQVSAEAFFGTDHKDARDAGLYQPYMDAVRQLAVIKHHTHHGTVTPELAEELGIGQTVCPACIGGDEPSGPAAFTMDGFESANKKSTERGGGGSHGSFEFTSVYFKEPAVQDVVAEAKAAKQTSRPKLGCDAQHKAGGVGGLKSVGKDIDMIIHVDCAAHSLVHRVYDVKGGERLVYADDVINWGKETFKSRGFVLGYDVACKELSHLDFYGLLQSIISTILFILFIPAMHVYAHGKDCLSLFSPRFLMGLGLTMDGEGHERVNSWLSRIIGLTQRETFENRRMDIVLFLEFYNWSKIRRLVSWTQEKLLATFAGLAEVKATLGHQWWKVEQAQYDVVVTAMTTLRQQLVERQNKDVPSTKEDLRLQIDQLARSILSMDKHLSRAPGTKMSKRLNGALNSTFLELYKKLDELNAMEPGNPPLTFAQVKAGLTPAAVESSQSDVDSFVRLYFRYCEDLFHHQNYLKNMVGFYERREMEHWRVVKEKVGVCDSRSKEAFMGLRRRRMEVEREHSRLAKEALNILTLMGNMPPCTSRSIWVKSERPFSRKTQC